MLNFLIFILDVEVNKLVKNIDLVNDTFDFYEVPGPENNTIQCKLTKDNRALSLSKEELQVLKLSTKIKSRTLQSFYRTINN